MRKSLFTVLILLFFLITASAQAYEGKIEYNKKDQAAFIMEYAFPPEAVEGAFVQKLGLLGYKGKEEKGIFNRDKGFINYQNITISEISSDQLNYIIKVERKSRKESEESVMYLVLIKGGNNAMSRLSADVKNKVRSYLENLLPEIEAFHLELNIKEQEDVVTKIEKKLNDLRDDQESMEKKIKNLQDDLKKNTKDQEETLKEIEAQKQALEALKSKRKIN